MTSSDRLLMALKSLDHHPPPLSTNWMLVGQYVGSRVCEVDKRWRVARMCRGCFGFVVCDILPGRGVGAA